MRIEEKIIDREVIRKNLASINRFPDSYSYRASHRANKIATKSVDIPSTHKSQNTHLGQRIKQLLIKKNARIIAHYYVDEAIQELAEETGGFVGDSLEMARFGNTTEADTLVVAGVKFMGETAKILNPEKQIIMPNIEATCSLDLSCPADEFAAFCEKHPDYTSVVYANTSAEVKAVADWVVTSSIAKDLIEQLHSEGEKIIWAPDKHLGSYLEKETGAQMLLWDGACIVHEEFQAKSLRDLQNVHPDAAILAHPESPGPVLEIADFVGSTSQLIREVNNRNNLTFIVATDRGIFYKMRQAAPDKSFIPAPTAGRGATCRSCAHCPWMGMNGLHNLAHSLDYETNNIEIPTHTMNAARKSLTRMLDFQATTN